MLRSLVLQSMNCKGTSSTSGLSNAPVLCSTHVHIDAQLYTNLCVHRIKQAPAFYHVHVKPLLQYLCVLFDLHKQYAQRQSAQSEFWGCKYYTQLSDYLCKAVLNPLAFSDCGNCRTAPVPPVWIGRTATEWFKEASIKTQPESCSNFSFPPSESAAARPPSQHSWPLQDGFTPLFPKLRQSQLFLLQQNILCRTANLSSASSVAHSISKNTSATLGGFRLPYTR